MAQWLAATQARLRAVIEGRGFDGSFGADAQARALRTGTFRRVLQPLREDVDGSVFDRAYFDRLDLGPYSGLPRNTRANRAQYSARYTLEIGYLAGNALAPTVHKVPITEDATVAVRDAEIRAQSDARNLALALEWNELHGNDTEPVIEAVQLATPPSVERLGNGRMVLVLAFDVFLDASATARSDP